MTYFNWKKSEPSNDGGVEDYIVWRMYDTDSGVWNDEQDTSKAGFLTLSKTYGVVCQDILPGKLIKDYIVIILQLSTISHDR